MILLPLLLGVAAADLALLTHTAVETEMFAIPISPNLFNWTYQEFDQQYKFHASLLGKPELPPWLRYIYSGRHHSGFIFGTPPRGTEQPITLEVIGLNRQDYETRRVKINLIIKSKGNMAMHEVELKIDNLNVEDLLDEHRMTRLKDILRTKLWTESHQDLYATFLASAIDMGARLPLKPEDGEGLVVRLGSSKPFSAELKRLREEVRPLSRLVHCPREYKRTTVERLFRDAGLTLDWCSFQLYNTVYDEKTTMHLEYLSEIPNKNKPSKKIHNPQDVWKAPSKMYLPSRGYMKQMTIVIAVPLFLTILIIGGLTVVVCFHYATIAHKSDKVEMCRYNTANTEQTQVPDNTSNKSTGVSPNNSLVRPYSPKSSTNLAGNYNRPQPPPYISGTNSLHHRKSTIERTPSTSDHTPEHRTALEESLKLLNEANISDFKAMPNDFKTLPSDFKNLTSDYKDPIVDLNDGTDDYVPIKTDGYVTMKGVESDDIEVPDLTKYMGVGI